MQEERIGGFYWPGFCLTEELLSQYFYWLRGKFAKISPFTIQLASLFGLLPIYTVCIFTKASESQQMAKQHPQAQRENGYKTLGKAGATFPAESAGKTKPPA